MEGLELELSVRGDFCSSQRLSSSYQGQGLVPSSWSRSSKVRADLPFKRVFSLLPRARTFWSIWGPCGLLAHVGVDRGPSCLWCALCRHLQLSFPPRRCRLGYKCRLSVTASQCPQPLLPMPCFGSTLQGRRGPHGLWTCITGWAVEEQHRQNLGCFWYVLEKAPPVATTAPPRLHHRTRSPLYPTVKSPPCWWPPQIQCWPFTWLRVGCAGCAGNPAAARADLCLPCLRGSPHMGACFKWTPGFPEPCCYSQQSSNEPCRLFFSFWCGIPGLWCSICGPDQSLPKVGVHPCNLPFSLNSLPGA